MSTQREPTFTAESLLTSYQVGSLLQVNPSSINKWIKDGRITAFRTPGGHRRIRAADLVQFLQSHHMPIPTPLQTVQAMRILLIDPDQQHANKVQTHLANGQWAVQVRTSSSGVDALLQLGSYKPHIVMIDGALTNPDGAEICRQLSKHQETAHIVTVWLQHGSHDNRASAAKHTFQKPLDVNALANKLALPAVVKEGEGAEKNPKDIK